MTFDAVSLWQPWASFCAMGIKPWETRSWAIPAKPGRPLAIHAAKRWSKEQAEWSFSLIHEALAWPDLPPELAAELRQILNTGPEVALPRGAIVGLCQRGPVHPTNNWQPPERFYLFGDFAPRRFAWELCRPIRTAAPVPYKGQQGFFEVELDPREFNDSSPVFWAPEIPAHKEEL